MKDNDYIHYVKKIIGATSVAPVGIFATSLGAKGYFGEAAEKFLESKVLDISAEYWAYVFIPMSWLIYTVIQGVNYHYSRPQENEAPPPEVVKPNVNTLAPAETMKHDGYKMVSVRGPVTIHEPKPIENPATIRNKVRKKHLFR